MTTFPIHTIESAPEGSKSALRGLYQAFGMIPNLAATMANSPALVSSFVAAFGQFSGGTFSAGERQVLLLTNAVTNSSPWAVAFHSTMALKEGVDPRDVDAVRRRTRPHDPRLAALSTLTRTLIEKRGHLDDLDIKAFTTAGFGRDQVLEVITGLAISTMASHTGNITAPPLEEPFRAQAWTVE
jgi:alkylhydroperoxidase family enzyme